MAFIEEHERDGLRVREFTLPGTGGDTGDRPITGVLWQGPDHQPGAPLVGLGHGASGDRYQDPLPWLARKLVGGHGFAVLAIDGPVHGRRKVGDGARGAFWPEWERPTTAAEMTADWQAALDLAQAQPDIGTGPVGYWGLSMGTVYGAPLCAADPRISVAVLGLMGMVGPESYQVELAAAAAQLTMPILFLHQLEDELFTREQYLALFDALASTDKRLHANPGLHPEVPMEELRHSVDFLVHRLLGGNRESGPTFVVSN